MQETPSTTDPRRDIESLRRLAHLLDSAIPLPGGMRIGLDGIIGLIPGIGDLAGTAVSSYIILRAQRLGVPSSVLLRMAGNVALETIIGVIPVLGDLFDFAWKANRRNVDLLERHLTDPRRTRRASRLAVGGVLVGLLVALGGLIYVVVLLVHWLWSRMQA